LFKKHESDNLGNLVIDGEMAFKQTLREWCGNGGRYGTEVSNSTKREIPYVCWTCIIVIVEE